MKLPSEIRLPVNSQSPRWRMSRSDWVAPIAMFVTSFLVIAIEQSLQTITNGQDISWTVIVLIPLLMAIRNLLSNGAETEGGES